MVMSIGANDDKPPDVGGIRLFFGTQSFFKMTTKHEGIDDGLLIGEHVNHHIDLGEKNGIGDGLPYMQQT